MLAPNRCPACLSWTTQTLTGGEFQDCSNCGTISARNRRTTAVYDQIYVASRYDRYSTTRAMSQLRMAIMENVIRLHESLEVNRRDVVQGRVLDVGYGNGDFIRAVRLGGWDAFGNDVNPTEYVGVRPASLPNGPDWPVSYRVITFFDALEHFEDLTHARWVSHAADWLILSFPCVPSDFPYHSYKHYRPGEHHMHFKPKGLEKIFSHNGRVAELVYHGHPEDSIRKRSGKLPNIDTVALRCFNA